MGMIVNELIREVVNLVWNVSDELQPLDEAFHFIFPPDLHFQHAAEKVVELVGTTSGSHYLDTFAHLLDGYTVLSGRMVHERLDELDAFLYLFGFEADEVERTAGEVLNGCSTEQRGM